MFKKTIKRIGITFATAMTISLGGMGLSASAQTASINQNPVETSRITLDNNLVQVRGFSKHYRIYRGGHRYRGHSRSFRRGGTYRRHGYSSYGYNRGYRSNRHSGYRGYSRYKRHHGHSFRRNIYPGFILSPKSR